MRAQRGDMLMLRAGDAKRMGSVLDVERTGAGEHYRVRWDDGAESVVFPQPNLRVMPAGERRTVEREVDLHFDEKGPLTAAMAEITVNGRRYAGRGEARCRPGDVEDTMIGEELAAARALEDLGLQLRAAAQKEIAAHDG